MLKLALGVLLIAGQLSGPASTLPQVLKPDYKAAAPIQAGKTGDLTVSFTLVSGYAINRTPPVSLTLSPVPGVTLVKTKFDSSPNDPKSKDEYYVDLPTLKVPVKAAKAGAYEIPGKLVYFFCSKKDGFCSRQAVDVKVPVTVH